MKERRAGERRASGSRAGGLGLVAEEPTAGAVRLTLGPEPLLIGRDPSNQLRNESADVSRFHCRVEPRATGTHVLVDAGSTYGTWLDGERVTGEVKLRPGQVIGLGDNGEHRIRVEPATGAPGGRAEAPAAIERSRVRAILAQVGATLDIEACLARAVEIVGDTLQAERVFLVLEHHGRLVARASRHAADRLAEDIDLPLPALQRAIARAEVRQWMPDPASSDAIERSLLSRGVTSAWFLPLHAFDGTRSSTPAPGAREFVGVVYAETRARGPARCDPGTLEFLETLGDVVALQLANARHHYRATHDLLTGLRNRSWLDETLDGLLERCAEGARASLVLADVDHFRGLNEAWGQASGDAVLREVAARLCRAARSVGTTCRLSGDELAVLLPGRPLAEAVVLAKVLRAAVADRPVQLPGREDAPVALPVTASFGVAELDPATMACRSDFVRAADRALQRAKQAGRNRVENA